VTTNHEYPAHDPPDDLDEVLSAAQIELADYVRAKVDTSAALMAIMAASGTDRITSNQLVTGGAPRGDARLAELNILSRAQEGPADSKRPATTEEGTEAAATEMGKAAAASVGADRPGRKPPVATVKRTFTGWARAASARWVPVTACVLAAAVVSGLCGLGLVLIAGAGGAGLAAIEAVSFAVAAGFAVIVAATVVVIVGVHQEERRLTIRSGRPPTVCALLARRVLGAHLYLIPEEQAKEDSRYEDPGKRPSRYEIPIARAEMIWPVRRR
jgi:hypothetical protein